MTQLAIMILIIDLIKLLKLFIKSDNSINIFTILIIIMIFFIYIFFIFFILLIMDVRRYNIGDDLIEINLKLKEEVLKKNKYYILVCKLLHIFRAQSVIYYHTRMYIFIVKYEYFKYYIYKNSFKIFIKKIINIQFRKIDIFLLKYYYKWLMIHNASSIKGDLKEIRQREIDINIFYIKKLKENLEDKKIIIRRKEYEPLVIKDKEYKELQKVKKLLNNRLIKIKSVKGWIEKENFPLRFSYYYSKFNHILFHYSISIFWLLTTTKNWFIEIRSKLIEPYIKEHIKYLIHQKEDQITLGRVPIYRSSETYENSGHSRIILPPDNWKITDEKLVKKSIYVYHFRVDSEYDWESPWHLKRDNEVWGHYSGTGIINDREKGIHKWNPEYYTTHWGSDIRVSKPWIPERPKLSPYFIGYRYIGYPERFFDYLIDLVIYIGEYIRYRTGYSIFDLRQGIDIDINDNIPAVFINFNTIFLFLFINIWVIFTIILVSRKVQIWVYYYSFYFIFLFLFSCYYYLQAYLFYFDYEFFIASFIYVIKLPFMYLKFNVSDLDYLYIFWLNILY